MKGGVGFFGMLAVMFIGLKITGHIAWSWWWALAPLWCPPLVVFVLLAIFACLAVYYGWLPPKKRGGWRA